MIPLTLQYHLMGEMLLDGWACTGTLDLGQCWIAQSEWGTD